MGKNTIVNNQPKSIYIINTDKQQGKGINHPPGKERTGGESD